jgi:hypothetical protein
MNEAAELEAALQFVIRRINEEAAQSGEPLTEEQRFLLEHLPTEPVLSPDCSHAHWHKMVGAIAVKKGNRDSPLGLSRPYSFA